MRSLRRSFFSSAMWVGLGGEYLMRKLRLFVLTIGVSLLVAGLLAPLSTAAAKPKSVTINLTAVVDRVDNADGVPLGNIEPGATITGSYTYNPETKDTDQSRESGAYQHNQPPYGIQLNMGSFSVVPEPGGVDFQIGIRNDSSSDSYSVTSFNNFTPGGGPQVDIISWGLGDSTGTALSNDQLQKKAPVLSSWQFNQLSLEGPTGARFLILVHVTQAVVV
jgi:hypothetical protein